MSKGQNLGLALIASFAMAASPAQADNCVPRNDGTGAVDCQRQVWQTYVPANTAQQQPPVVVEQPSPAATFFTSLAAGVVGAVVGNAIANHGRHHGGPGYGGGPRYVAPADIPRLDSNPWSPNYGHCVTQRGSVRVCRP